MHWHQGIVEALEGHVASLGPDAVVLNTGFWARMPGAMDVAHLAAAGHRAVHAKNGLMFFKTTTTPTNQGPIDDAAFSDRIEEYGWRIFDAGGITRLLPGINTALQEAGVQEALYWDNVHFYPQGKTGWVKSTRRENTVDLITHFALFSSYSVYSGLNHALLNVLCNEFSQNKGGRHDKAAKS